MKWRNIGVWVAGVLSFSAISGCRPAQTPAQALRDEWCEANADAVVELIPQGMQPTRPNQAIGVVEAYWFFTEEAKVHILRVKACKLGADAVMDVTPPPMQSVEVTTQTVETPVGRITETREKPGTTVKQPGRGYALRYTDIPRPAPTGQGPSAPPAQGTSAPPATPRDEI